MLFLQDKFLLTNNTLLFRAYALLGEEKKTSVLKEKINQNFWTGSYYRDYLGQDDFDTLGNAWAILFDIAPENYYEPVINKLKELDTPYGYKTNNVLPAPASQKEKFIIEKTTQYSVIWPFITGFAI